MKKLALHWQIIIGLLLGVAWAMVANLAGWQEFTINWVSPWGKIFISLLKLIAVPLVLFSILSGLASLPNAKGLGRMGVKTIFAYLTTTILAISIGLVLVNVINPGSFVEDDTRVEKRLTYEIWAEQEGIAVVDDKVFLGDEKYAELEAAARERVGAEEVPDKVKKGVAVANSREDSKPLDFIVNIVPDNIFKSLQSNSLLLQVIFFALFFGISMMFIPDSTKEPLVGFINATNEVFLKMIDLIMKAAPFFVFALMADLVSVIPKDEPGKVTEILQLLGVYSLVVILGLCIVAYVIYPLIIQFLVPKLGALKFLKGMREAQTMAFSTSSSAATLPITMDCVRDNLKVSNKITSFVLPIGATVNMDGTSLYQAVAVVFMAQMHMIELSFALQMTILLTAMLASIGTAGVPGAGVVMIAIVLLAVDLNPEWIGIILAVDRILDMLRTTVNVTGDAMVATVIARTEGEIEYEN